MLQAHWYKQLCCLCTRVLINITSSRHVLNHEILIGVITY